MVETSREQVFSANSAFVAYRVKPELVGGEQRYLVVHKRSGLVINDLSRITSDGFTDEPGGVNGVLGMPRVTASRASAPDRQCG